MPSKPKNRPKTPAKPVVVKIDAALARLYRDALSRLTRASTEGARSWDARYEAIAAITQHEPPLYLAGGYSTEGQFFEAHVHEDRTSVYRNMRVAKYATAADLERYGASVLDLAIAYLEATHGPTNGRAPVDFEKLRIPVGADGDTRPLSQVTAAELREALRRVRTHDAASKKASPAAQLIAALLKKAGATHVSFSLGSRGIVLHAPLTELASAGKALSGFVPPPAPAPAAPQ